MSQDLNYNVMFSQRGVLNLGHSLQDMRDIARRVNANRLNGVDGEMLDAAQVKAMVPIINTSPNARYPILGASLQRRGGVARHDAVAWGFARGADARGVDIIQNCEVTGIRRESGQVVGRGDERAASSRRRRSASSPPAIRACSPSMVEPAPADREPSAAGARVRADQAGAPHRGDVGRRARLHQPVRQGRSRDRRRHRSLQRLRPARQLLGDREHAARRSSSCSRSSAACG